MTTQKETIAVDSRILNPNSGFKSKMLCTGPTFTAGTACAFSCAYCYVPSIMRKLTKDLLVGKNYQSVIIRRNNPVELLKKELHNAKGIPKHAGETGVIYGSPLVDIAATDELARETIEMCKVILTSTGWDIRLLSKSCLIEQIADGIPAMYKGRVIFGLSTGTLDDSVAAAIEPDAPAPSDRLATLRHLQKEGYRTFAMLCPIMPQDVTAYVNQLKKRIDLEKCEHVWAEVLNGRGDNFDQVGEALRVADLKPWADRLNNVSKGDTWEKYAKEVFEALAKIVPRNPNEPKLRFLQYVDKNSEAYWKSQETNGAIVLRSEPKKTVASPESVPATTIPSATIPVALTTAVIAPASLTKRQLAAKKAWVTIRAKKLLGASPAAPVAPVATTPSVAIPATLATAVIAPASLTKRQLASKKAWVTIRANQAKALAAKAQNQNSGTQNSQPSNLPTQ